MLTEIKIIIDKTDYINKCQEHISQYPYKYLKRDPTDSIKRKAVKKLLKLKEKVYRR